MSSLHTDYVRLTVAQAVGYSGRATATLHRALESGELHGGQRKKGGRWSIRRECLDAWLDGEQCPHQRKAAS